ncbi:MAG: transketolase [Saccharofermentanales bacterium]|jgi:transketolase
MTNRHMDDRAVTAIRALAMDGVEAARSGHPGMPLGAAPMAYELWAHHMRHNPHHPRWINRDRFVLSAGHASMLLYALLYLFDYGLSIDDLQSFRQWQSKTPGHPEFGVTRGVETTTGPLGQGFAMACGMAVAEAHLAARYNTDEHTIFDHYTYVLCGDGDLMEGVSSEAASLAGTMKLGKLIVLYDANHTTIEGSTDLAFTEDVAARFEAYGWHVLTVLDGNDRAAISRALDEARARADRPSLIKVETKIGYASPLEGQSASHGAPLGPDNVAATKRALRWPETLKPFEVPEDILAHGRAMAADGEAEEQAWQKEYDAWAEANPDLARSLEAAYRRTDLDRVTLDELVALTDRDEATRATSGTVLNHLAACSDALFGGSADLAPSNKTAIRNATSFGPTTPEGSVVHFGVREFAMAAMANGVALHGGLRPYVATFFVFSDYLKPALRLSALMGLPVIFILTHDSIGVGEDGATHQPIEHLSMMRSIPNVTVDRPAGRCETAASWYEAIHRDDGPSLLILSRQAIRADETSAEGVARGAYILRDGGDLPDVILMASGSEVEIALGAADLLEAEGYRVRVVSMVSMERFERQDASYKASVLPDACRRRVAVEAGAAMPWYRYVGLDGAVVGIDRFGASAPADALWEPYGMTAEHVADTARALL